MRLLILFVILAGFANAVFAQVEHHVRFKLYSEGTRISKKQAKRIIVTDRRRKNDANATTGYQVRFDKKSGYFVYDAKGLGEPRIQIEWKGKFLNLTGLIQPGNSQYDSIPFSHSYFEDSGGLMRPGNEISLDTVIFNRTSYARKQILDWELVLKKRNSPRAHIDYDCDIAVVDQAYIATKIVQDERFYWIHIRVSVDPILRPFNDVKSLTPIVRDRAGKLVAEKRNGMEMQKDGGLYNFRMPFDGDLLPFNDTLTLQLVPRLDNGRLGRNTNCKLLFKVGDPLKKLIVDLKPFKSAVLQLPPGLSWCIDQIIGPTMDQVKFAYVEQDAVLDTSQPFLEGAFLDVLNLSRRNLRVVLKACQ